MKIILNAGKEREKLDYYAWLMGSKKWLSHSGNILTSFFFWKVHINYIMTQHLNSLANITEKNKNLYSHKKTVNEDLQQFLCNSSKLERTQISFNRWITKQSMEYSYHRRQISNKKEDTWYTQWSGWIARKLCWVKKTWKVTCYMIPCIKYFWNTKVIKMQNRLALSGIKEIFL